MQKKNKRGILSRLTFVIVIATLFSSCVNYNEIKIEDVEGVKLIELTDSGLTLESEVKINNPNYFSISIVDSDLKFALKNQEIGFIKIENKVKLEGNTSKYYTLQLSSNLSSLGEGSMGKLLAIAASNGKMVPFKLKGYIVGRAFFISKKVDILHEDSVKLDLF